MMLPTAKKQEMIISMSKNVQISRDLFLDLVRYFCLDDTSKTRSEAIRDAVETKLDKLVKHELYSTSKTALTEEERETARQQYLDHVGIHKDFRW